MLNTVTLALVSGTGLSQADKESLLTAIGDLAWRTPQEYNIPDVVEDLRMQREILIVHLNLLLMMVLGEFLS